MLNPLVIHTSARAKSLGWSTPFVRTRAAKHLEGSAPSLPGTGAFARKTVRVARGRPVRGTDGAVPSSGPRFSSFGKLPYSGVTS